MCLQSCRLIERGDKGRVVIESAQIRDDGPKDQAQHEQQIIVGPAHCSRDARLPTYATMVLVLGVVAHVLVNHDR